ncbi:putative late blight resistance protein homolog R1B-16 isoform X2 [Andrographis paniculata]|uniref:putative late blight resistance protein homolog R1B-16 isoform X2 n=1 Tax=Andrographis paniculata TaxID=175694 RepID=UPI0021E74942|nr:putative late blight resistance protein homolog R1B-16 isoform X2 [Andrographis paniculata]
MASSYAAVLSLLQLLQDIQRPSGGWNICLDELQIQLLRDRLSYFMAFLEDFHGKSEAADALATQIMDASRAAQGIINSFVSVHVLRRHINLGVLDLPSYARDIQAIIQKMDVLRERALEVRDEIVAVDLKSFNPPIVAAAHSRQAAPTAKNPMVGLDDALVQIRDKLTGSGSKLETIPIVGMGGIGKTTLALNVYNNDWVVEHFDIRVWITISQTYTLREILLELSESGIGEKSEEEIGELVYKRLFGRRYLIVLDDVWNIEAWNVLRRFLPDNGNGSRVLLTTRLVGVAADFGSDIPYAMKLLKKDKSWDMLHDIVFPEEVCPVELEKIGKKIATGCRGLPLAIAVIGGVLRRSEKTFESWDQVAENLNAIVTWENEEHCFKILRMSYTCLPLHLKPCFLYVSRFREDQKIKVSELIKFWVAEGFLRPINGKILEDVAREYLDHLIDRNLIVVRRRGVSGKAKYCGVHDLVRDLSLKEARKENFILVEKLSSNSSVFVWKLRSEDGRLLSKLLSSQASYKLNNNLVESIVHLVQFRYLSVPNHTNWLVEKKPKMLPFLWNLQTISIHGIRTKITIPSMFWTMTQLRHINIISYIVLPEPPPNSQSCCTLENLQSLFYVKDFKCSEEIYSRIPNVKKLRVEYFSQDVEEGPYYSLSNLVHLCRLESLDLYGMMVSIKDISFPHSLRKLSIGNTNIWWCEMVSIGSLPNLEILVIREDGVKGLEWNVTEGEFVRLKRLDVCLVDLKYWKTEEGSFPSLEELELWSMLEELPDPLDFADIPKLRSIKLIACSESIESWAKQIKEEREELGYGSIQLFD